MFVAVCREIVADISPSNAPLVRGGPRLKPRGCATKRAVCASPWFQYGSNLLTNLHTGCIPSAETASQPSIALNVWPTPRASQAHESVCLRQSGLPVDPPSGVSTVLASARV